MSKPDPTMRQKHADAPTFDTASDTPVPAEGSGYRDLRRGLVSAILGLAAYYGARSLGASPLDALLLATLVCLLRALYSAVKERRFDPIAWFLMAADAVTLLVGLCTRSPVTIMFGQHLPGVLFLAFVVGGLLVGRPITESLITWLRPGWVQRHIANHDWTPDDLAAYHRTHIHLTAAIIAAQTLHLAAAAAVILTLNVDAAKGLLGVLALITDAVVLAITVGGIARFLLRHTR